VARNLLIFFFFATFAVLLGNGYYKSFQSGVLTTIKGFTARRDKEAIKYWIGMAAGILGFLVMVSATAVMAFLVCVDLFGTSK
jgi:hypothetical protein